MPLVYLSYAFDMAFTCLCYAFAMPLPPLQKVVKNGQKWQKTAKTCFFLLFSSFSCFFLPKAA
tara:strand:+ start:633 stop:821 length:189 start_codon:yes stop_codon:yes gene_type:complete